MWNLVDNPEMLGTGKYNEFFVGQSFIKFNYRNISLGISSENLWWGPSMRNSIMMSNNARGFHYSFQTNKPILL